MNNKKKAERILEFHDIEHDSDVVLMKQSTIEYFSPQVAKAYLEALELLKACQGHGDFMHPFAVQQAIEKFLLEQESE